MPVNEMITIAAKENYKEQQISCGPTQLASLSVRVLCVPRLINPRCVLPSKSPSLRLTCATMMAFLSPIVTKSLLYQQPDQLFLEFCTNSCCQRFACFVTS